MTASMQAQAGATPCLGSASTSLRSTINTQSQNVHTRTHARTHARTHVCTHAHGVLTSQPTQTPEPEKDRLDDMQVVDEEHTAVV